MSSQEVEWDKLEKMNIFLKDKASDIHPVYLLWKDWKQQQFNPKSD